MKHRLCLPHLATQPATPLRADTDPIRLEKEQAHYLHRVLRLSVDSEIGVFDGQGREWRARLSVSQPRRVELSIIELTRNEHPPTPLILAQSWLKGGAMDTVVQKAVELGATAIWLLAAQRSNLKLDRNRRANKLAHLERIAMAAVEQCESVWLPALQDHSNLDDLLAHLGREDPAQERIQTLLLDLEAPPLAVEPTPRPLMVLVGPEGGWSTEERLCASRMRNVVSAGLGELTLRAETAPLAALAAIRHSWGWAR